MALIEAAELKASREADAAGVSDVSDTDVTEAIAEAEAELYQWLGYRIEDTATSVTLRGNEAGRIMSPSRVRSVSSITEDGVTFPTTEYFVVDNDFFVAREYGDWTAEAIVITGTFGYTSSDSKWVLAKRAVKLLAIDKLEATNPSNLPSAPGGRLVGYTSENAAFTFDEPAVSERTGVPEVDKLIDLIGPIWAMA